MSEFRVGTGYDIHPLVAGRPLILCGVEIPSSLGLGGHSDADCAIHAVIDALLTAIAQGDIGSHFPDADPAYENADSSLLFREAYRLVQNEGYHLVNLSLTVIAERPKLGPCREAMQARLAALFGAKSAQIGIAFKTNEGFGPVGEGKAIACLATVLLERKPS